MGIANEAPPVRVVDRECIANLRESVEQFLRMQDGHASRLPLEQMPLGLANDGATICAAINYRIDGPRRFA